MHGLRRPEPPECLAAYRHGRDNWETFHKNPAHVEQVRAALDGMQQGQCAYCEDRLADRWHVEHLWPKSRYPNRTFLWQNLFGSCNRKHSCGTHKDQGGRPYEPKDLIDPASDDPDQYLLFGVDGMVSPRDGLATADRRRAEETIRVFNLNAPDLCRERARVVKTLLQSDPDMVDVLADVPIDERHEWVADLLNDYCCGCFITPVRHLFLA